MNYTELTANIQTICENTFEATELAMFTQQAEQKIYATVGNGKQQLPDYAYGHVVRVFACGH